MGFLRNQYAKAPAERNFGILPTPPGYRERFEIARHSAPHILQADERRDTVLWPYLFRAFPQWTYGVQGTGDCVSWQNKHILDVLMAVLVHVKKQPFEIRAEVRQEAIYGFGRVEVFGKNYAGGAGMFGAAAAKAIRSLGTLHALNYAELGYDLRTYSGARAIEWGRTGVPDVLEPTASKHRAGEEILVTDAVMGGALIQQGYPLGYCGFTYWGRRRDAAGVGTQFSSGWHGMTITGVRYDPQTKQPSHFWVANTGHGNHVSGPVGPYAMPDRYAACGSWVPVRLVQPVLAAGDCFAHSFYEGFPLTHLPDYGTHERLG